MCERGVGSRQRGSAAPAVGSLELGWWWLLFRAVQLVLVRSRFSSFLILVTFSQMCSSSVIH